MMKYLKLAACAAAAAALVLAASCVSSQKTFPPSPPSEAEIIASGEKLFAAGKLREARDAWEAIPDPAARTIYTDYARAYEAYDKAVAVAEAVLAASEPEKAITAGETAGKPPSAPSAITEPDPLAARARLSRVESDAAKALAVSASEAERAADASLAAARAKTKGDPAANANGAAKGYGEAERLFRAASDWVEEAKPGAERSASKAVEAKTLYDRILKDTLLAFPERMGEVFARSPSGSEKLGDKELLDFNAETAAIIRGGLSEFDRIVADHPGLLDSVTLDRLRDSARGLSSRFTRVETAIKAVKDRGKPVMPLIIGIFNPQPGDPQRSRPASFQGGAVSDSDWWWGIADIPKSVAQDLVITMSDSRPVRVYAAGMGAGGKKPSSDLINPLFRVGNSWPVLNAGARLNDGVFHIEVGPARAGSYSGEAVVYKSFMTRTR